MANIYETQRQQITQRANKQGVQDEEAMARRFQAMGGGPGSGAAEKMRAKAATARQSQANEAIAGVDARESAANEEIERQNAQNTFAAGEAQKNRDASESQFSRNLGFQTSQANTAKEQFDKQFMENRVARERQEALQSAKFKADLKEKEEDANFFSGKNLAGMGRGLIGGALGLLSDKDAKKDIKPGGTAIDRFFEKLNAKEYEYKDASNGEGKQYGFIAQDIEKDPVGKSMVSEEGGEKRVDMNKGAAVMMAEMSAMHRRLKKLEKEAS